MGGGPLGTESVPALLLLAEVSAGGVGVELGVVAGGAGVEPVVGPEADPDVVPVVVPVDDPLDGCVLGGCAV